ncbi:hypothetical protein AB0G04_14385 [Actinoplanes sp. NPDC023801]|uniref:hypothetical protein n=1 Tax=Actinoplanes sp. NPDC023801 TaxID=3154595 RepID=UPI0033D30AD9
MTNTRAGLARTTARVWWSVGTVLVANGALVTMILSGRLRQVTGDGGWLVPIDFMLGPVGLGALTVGLAVALRIAWRQRATAGPPVTGIGRGIGATAVGWALAIGLDVAATIVVFYM